MSDTGSPSRAGSARPSARSLAFGLLAGLALLFAAGDALAQGARYRCDGGLNFSSEPRRGGTALMLFFGPHKVLLDRTLSGFESRYSGGGYDLVERRGNATLTRPEEVPVECFAEGRPGGGSGGVARPSFPCSGNLNATERAICASPPLARLDRQMADTYVLLTERLTGANRSLLQRDQQNWIAQRNACADRFGCLEDSYLERIAELEEWEEPAPPPPPPPSAGGFPRQAVSWGGAVRSGPGVEYPRLTGLAQGTPITILSNSGVRFNGYLWFEIRFGSQRGYQWGGIICPIGRPLDGTFQTC